jgi:hypothetical protein
MSQTEVLGTELDKAIAHAVTARVEAEVVKALSGDQVIGKYVAAALAQPIEVSSRNSYSKEKVPFLKTILDSAIRQATQDAVRALIAEELPMIQDEVRKALKRSAGTIAETLANSLASAAEKAYGVSVDLTLKMPSS